MPTPYAEPPPQQLVRLVIARAAGAFAAAAGKSSVRVAGNTSVASGPVTGTFVTFAQVDAGVLAPSQVVVVTGSVSADVTSAALSGQIEMQLVDSISGVLVTPVKQSYPTDATGVSASYTVSVAAPAAGDHIYRMQLRATGDGSLAVPIGRATIVVTVVG